MYKAIIFDRDGTLNRTTRILRDGQKHGDPTDGYVLAPDELELFDGVPEALASLTRNGIACFVFTQQNCVKKNLVSQLDIEVIHKHMNRLLGGAIISFHVAVSPDDPKAKPAPTMIEDILNQNHLAKKDVLVVGDSKRDYQAAMAAGVDFAWVRDDLCRVAEAEMIATGCPVFDSVSQLVKNYILAKPAPCVAAPQK